MHDINNWQSVLKRCTHRLYIEYEYICNNFKLKLKIPSIIISSKLPYLGLWDSAKKTIFLAEELIKKYTWPIIIQVLKHEIAHQIVSEIFQQADNHGSYFKQACKMLDVEEQFCRATINIDEKIIHWKDVEQAPEEKKLIDKIQKLLNLTQSANEHEAALAMAKVQELYSKYNIDHLQINQQSAYYTLSINLKKKIITIIHSLAAHILQNHFFVQVIYATFYDHINDNSYKTIEIIGLKQNVLMAEYVFHFLLQQSTTLWKLYAQGKKLSKKYQISFQHGILSGFDKQLDEAKEKLAKFYGPTNWQALIKSGDLELSNYIKLKFPQLTRHFKSARSVYTEHFNAGLLEGKNMQLNKPIAVTQKKIAAKT